MPFGKNRMPGQPKQTRGGMSKMTLPPQGGAGSATNVPGRSKVPKRRWAAPKMKKKGAGVGGTIGAQLGGLMGTKQY